MLTFVSVNHLSLSKGCNNKFHTVVVVVVLLLLLLTTLVDICS